MLTRRIRFRTRILSYGLVPALLLLSQKAQANEGSAGAASPNTETRAAESPDSKIPEAPSAQPASAEPAPVPTEPSPKEATRPPTQQETSPEHQAAEKAMPPQGEEPSKEETAPHKEANAHATAAEAAHGTKSEAEAQPEKPTGPTHDTATKPTANTEDHGKQPEAKAAGAHKTTEPVKGHAAPAESGQEQAAPAAKDPHGSKNQVEHPATKSGDAHAAPHGNEAAAGTGHGTAAKDAHGAAANEHGEKGEVPDEIMTMQAAELMKYSDKAYENGRYDTALIGYRQLLSYKIPKAQIRTALLGFGRTLKKKGELTKAVAVFERLIKDFPAEQDSPEIYLELGRCQRALGAYKTAINRFYSVINSTIKLTEDGAAKYRQLAKTAQFEIAETYFISGDYKEAMRFYSRLRLLDLNPTDRARAHFKAAYSQQLAGDHLGAITQLRSFIELNPEDENVPEARYIIAMSLRALGRSQEALFEALELLKTERTRTAQDPKRWAYWQRKTGNQIANEFYNQGDTNSALMIYLSLVELSSEASWRAPMLYQIALCQERQGRKDKAIENYKSILDIAAAQKGDEARKADFAELARMATWRLSQIEWVHKAEQRLNTILPNIEAEGSQPPAPAPK